MKIHEDVAVEFIDREEASVLTHLSLSAGETVVLDVNDGAWSARIGGRVLSCRSALGNGTFRCRLELTLAGGDPDTPTASPGVWRPGTVGRLGSGEPGWLNASLEEVVAVQALNVSQSGCLLACRNAVAPRTSGELQVKVGEALCVDDVYVVRCEAGGGSRWPFVVGVGLLPIRRIGPETVRGAIGEAASSRGWLARV